MALTHVLTDSILQQRHLMALTHVLTDSILWQRHLMALTHVLTYIILQQRYLMALTHVLTYNILRQRHVMALTCVLTDSILQQRLLMALTHFKVYCIIEINQSLSDVISCTLIDCCTRSWYNSRWLDVLRHRVLLETFIKKTSILMISDDQKKFIPISENMYQCLLNYNCIFVVVVSTITWTYVINLCVVRDQYLHTHFDFVDYYMYNVCILSEIIKFASTSFWNRKKKRTIGELFYPVFASCTDKIYFHWQYTYIVFFLEYQKVQKQLMNFTNKRRGTITSSLYSNRCLPYALSESGTRKKHY